MKEFYVSPEGETAEQYKRNRVIQMADIQMQAKAKLFLTEEEAADISAVDADKVREAYARATNELLANSIITLRRQKAEDEKLVIAELEK